MRRWAGWILAGYLLAGCAPFLTATGGKLTLSDQGFEVDLPQGWYRFGQQEDLVLTRDGHLLQLIELDRVPVEKELPFTKRKFAPGMLPIDVAEVEADNIRTNPNVLNFELLENAPATVGGRPGFRMVFTWKTGEGLRVKNVWYGFLEGKWVYRLVYQAAARHYFDRDLPTFEKIRESFHLIEKAT